MGRTGMVSFVANLTAVCISLLVIPPLASAPAMADPVISTDQPLNWATSANGSTISRLEPRDDQSLTIFVHSASMNREIPLDVLRPKDTSAPRPTLYLLNGAGGGEDGASWRARTDFVAFFADKNVNVVTPLGGAWSYYTDWNSPDPVLGVNKWTTFLTQEIPPLIDAALGTSGANAVAGLSTSGTSVFQLAIAKPGLYRAVAAYSGCAQTSDPIGQLYVRLAVESWGRGKTENMWGKPNDPDWAANDPYLHADKLRGLAIYVSNGSGLPGAHDTFDDPDINWSPFALVNQIGLGGLIEAATNQCTHNLADRLAQLQIPAHFNFRPTGTHSWGYWQDDLKDSWPVLAGALAG